MAAYAKVTFVSTMKLAGLLGGIFILAWVVVIAFERFSSGFVDFLFSWLGLGFSVVFASLFAVMRRAIVRERV